MEPIMTKTSKINSVTLVIAHPDDEVMFFAPTLLNFDEQLPNDIPFNVVCYSNGDAEGLGEIRAKELSHSVSLLLSQRPTNVTLLDHHDGMHEVWDTSLMLQQLEKVIASPERNQRETTNVILTFDKNGVSNHVNHKSCYEMVSKYHEKYIKDTIILTIDSYHNNLLLKYSSFGWQCLKVLNSLYNPLTQPDHSIPFNRTHMTIFNSYPQYILSLASMLNAHKSQMVWYRYFWWTFSRFVFVNDIHIIE